MTEEEENGTFQAESTTGAAAKVFYETGGVLEVGGSTIALSDLTELVTQQGWG